MYATGAYQKLLATIEQEAAVTEAFRISEQKFAQGALSVYEFNIQKSKYFITRSSTLQARYEYEFRIKIMDFYIAQSH
jgi:outer membrane protein